MNINDSSFYISKIKIILLGDPSVGKTSIISAVRQIDFQDKQQPTVGIDFFSKIVSVNNRSYKLQFWDTAGQQRFRSIIPSYVRNASVGIIVFDVHNRTTYQNVWNWLESFRQNSPSFSNIIVVGNKIDLEGRQVTQQQALRKFQSQNVNYIQISAKTSQNIQKLTQKLIGCINASQKDISQQEMRTKSYTKLQKLTEEVVKAEKKKKRCCAI